MALNDYNQNGSSAMYMWEWLDNRLNADDLSEAKGHRPLIDIMRDMLRHRGKSGEKVGYRSRAFNDALSSYLNHPKLADHFKAAAKKMGKNMTGDDVKQMMVMGRNAEGGIADEKKVRRGKDKDDEGDGDQAPSSRSRIDAFLDDHVGKLVKRHDSGKEVTHDHVGNLIHTAAKSAGVDVMRGEGREKRGGNVKTGQGGGGDDDATAPFEHGRDPSAESKVTDADVRRHYKRKKLELKGDREGLRKAMHDYLASNGMLPAKDLGYKNKGGKGEPQRAFTMQDLDRIEAHGTFGPGRGQGGASYKGGPGKYTQMGPGEEKALADFKMARRKKLSKILGTEDPEAQAKRWASNRKLRDAGEVPKQATTADLQKASALDTTPLEFKTQIGRKRLGGGARETKAQHAARLSQELLKRKFPGRGQTHFVVKKGKRKGEKDPTGISPDETEEEFGERVRQARVDIARRIKRTGSPRGYESKRLEGDPTPAQKFATVGPRVHNKQPAVTRSKDGKGWDIKKAGKALAPQRERQEKALRAGALAQAQGELRGKRMDDTVVPDASGDDEKAKKTKKAQTFSQMIAKKMGAAAGLSSPGQVTQQVMDPLRASIRAQLPDGFAVNVPLPDRSAGRKTGGSTKRSRRPKLPDIDEPGSQDKNKRKQLTPDGGIERMRQTALGHRVASMLGKKGRDDLEKTREAGLKSAKQTLGIRKKRLDRDEKSFRSRTRPQPATGRVDVTSGDRSKVTRTAPKNVQRKFKKGEWTGEYTSKGVKQTRYDHDRQGEPGFGPNLPLYRNKKIVVDPEVVKKPRPGEFRDGGELKSAKSSPRDMIDAAKRKRKERQGKSRPATPVRGRRSFGGGGAGPLGIGDYPEPLSSSEKREKSARLARGARKPYEGMVNKELKRRQEESLLSKVLGGGRLSEGRRSSRSLWDRVTA